MHERERRLIVHGQERGSSRSRRPTRADQEWYDGQGAVVSSRLGRACTPSRMVECGGGVGSVAAPNAEGSVPWRRELSTAHFFFPAPTQNTSPRRWTSQAASRRCQTRWSGRWRPCQRPTNRRGISDLWALAKCREVPQRTRGARRSRQHPPLPLSPRRHVHRLPPPPWMRIPHGWSRCRRCHQTVAGFRGPARARSMHHRPA